MVFSEDSSKSMITLANYMMKRRKWPYQGWHKRFFRLEKGFMTYGKSEQSVSWSSSVSPMSFGCVGEPWPPQW
jgi:hypothetical protein